MYTAEMYDTHSLNREVHEAERWMREEFIQWSMSVHREGSRVLKAVCRRREMVPNIKGAVSRDSDELKVLYGKTEHN